MERIARARARPTCVPLRSFTGTAPTVSRDQTDSIIGAELRDTPPRRNRRFPLGLAPPIHPPTHLPTYLPTVSAVKSEGSLSFGRVNRA